MQLQSLIYSPIPQQGPQGQQKKHTSRESSSLLNLLIICCLVVSAALPQVAAHMDETISMQEGKVVVLPCPVNKKTCGDLHSINWFKGDHRIAVYLSDESNSTNVEEPYEDRVSVTVDPYQLIIRDLKIEDEDIYMCDTTYFIPAETCENFNGYRIELNVLVPPSEVTVLDEKGDRIENNSIVGPLQERQTLKASCVVRNTRPQPQVGWWRGDKRLTTHSPSYDEMDGLYTATLELVHQLTRDDLANDIECRAESSAIPTAIKYRFGVDLQVRPTSITINGVEHHTVQGSKVVLTCDIHGARPPVNLTWYNNTVNINPEENELTDIRTRAFEKEDGTYHTQSELIFNATRFENDKVFRCDAENIVLQINREKPFTSSLTLEVLYPPVVKVSPPKLTVNTSDTVLLNCEYVANPASLTHVVWFRNGEMINVNDTNRYTGGNSENVALVIKSSAKNDIGNYSCQLSNVIGKGVSEEQLSLDVQYVPKVEVLMMPEGPVKEDDESNVTLYCNILDANPALLTRVRWYANSSLLKELPDCDETREDLCHVDPSKLLLESIGRGFFYNYSCEGFNAAGWGPRSKERELVVYYEPGPATLTHFPLVAIKKKSVTFSCHVEEPGYPESNRFRWLRGGRGPLQDIVTRDWTVEPVGLDSRTNYSCYAFNEGGKGGMATVNLDVHAPPFFIRNLPQYTGFYHSVPYANLTCRIECVPRCEITWLKDGTPIDKNDTRFFVKEKYMEASPATGDFESMLSVLHFNMSNWKNGRFDILKDNYNFTCMSSPNSVGPGIKSTTCVSIEYAPENTTVSEDTVYVVENTVPGRVICKSKAIPEPKFEWFFNNKSIILSNALIINTPMTRNDSGRYTCVAKNRHGVSTAETYIDVQFKPRCTLERQRLEGQDTLICTAYGNPAEASFTWSIKMENESMDWLGDADSRNHKDKSFYVLEEDYAIARTYRCVANNTVGDGPFCEIEVAEQLAWWLRWDKTTLIILVAVILILLLTVIIICCIIICVCRRRRRQEKYDTDVSINTLQSVFSRRSHTNTTTVTATTPTTPQVDTQKTLWANANETLIAPQLLLITEPNTTIITANNSTADPLNNHNNNNNNNNDDEDQTQGNNSADVPAEASESAEIITPKSVVVLQAPKSPPRWPLRPGVMLHVSRDTKQNLAENRMTLKPASSNNTSSISESSGVIFTSSPLRTKDSAPAAQSTPTSTSGKFERRVQQFLVQLFRRAKGASSDSTRDSQRSHVGLLSGMIFGRRQPCPDTQFDTQHRLKGIRCSGSVTYKKTHTTVATTTATATATTTTSLATPTHNSSQQLTLNNTQNSSYIINHIITQTAMTSSSQAPQQPLLQPPPPPPPPPALITVTSTLPPPPRPPVVTRAVQRSVSCGHSKQSPACAIYPKPCCNITTTQTQTETPTQTQSSLTASATIVTAVAAQSAPNNPKQSGSLSAGSTPMRSILKNRTPPPMAPPRSKAKAMSHTTHAQLGLVQMQEKSSTMGDLLTEPGEYENLPFHGLQTAPNKSNFTTPTDFNNDSSHVVLVAPRPKRLTNGQIHQEHKQRQKLRPEDFDIIERYDQIVNSEIQQQQQQQQHLRLTTQNPKTTTTTTTSASAKNLQGVFNDRMMEIGLPVSSASNTMPTKIVEVSSADCEIDRRVMNTQRVATNSNNCCSKSYTEYYQQQQQQQQKHNANISGLPTYAVIDQYHQERVGVTAAASTNPFLAISNFKKFDTEDNKAKSVLSFLARQDTSDSKFYTLKLPGKNKNHTNSQYKSSFGIFRFNTSTSSNGSGKHVTATSHSADKHERECDFMPNSTAEKPSLKCKRHHSFTGGSIGDIDAVGRLTLQRNMALGYGGNYAATSLRRNASGELNCLEQYDTELLPPQLKTKDSSVGLPFYENLNECTADTSSSHHSPIHYNHPHNHNQNQNHTQNMTTTAAKSRHLQIMSHFEPTSSTIGAILHGQSNRKGLRKQKQHHQRQHQQKDDLNLGVIEAERLSIYRSDSGISNSSYECVTPIPGMLGMSRAHIGSTPPPHKVNKVPKQGKSGKIPKTANHKIDAPFHVASVLSQKRTPRQQEELDKRDVSPVPTLINSSYESASSSQIDGNMGCGSNSTATDPLSLSSGNDSNMALNRSRNCLRHQRPSDLKTLEDFEQYRLGHNYGHSVSFLDQINCQNMRDISPSNKPLSAANFDDELIYADLESQHYGPINYKAASIYAQVKKNRKTGALEEIK